MIVRVLLFARLKREAEIEHAEVDVPAGASVREVARQVSERFGVSLGGCMVAVNEQYATPDTPLSENDEVAFLPPVAGGSGE